MPIEKKRRSIIPSIKIVPSSKLAIKIQHAKGIVYKDGVIYPKKGYKLIRETGDLIHVLREDEKNIAFSETRIIAVGLYVFMLWCRCPGKDANDDPCYIEDKEGQWNCGGAECCAGEGLISHPELGIITFGF